MILAKLSTLEQVKAGGIFKYVRLPDGSFRFSDVLTYPEHRFMLDGSKGEQAVSAGTVRVPIGGQEPSMEGYGSFTLGIKRPMDDDLSLISGLIGS